MFGKVGLVGVGSAGSGRAGRGVAAEEGEEDERKNLLKDLERLVRRVRGADASIPSTGEDEGEGSTFDDDGKYVDLEAFFDDGVAEETTDVVLFAATESKSRGGFVGKARGETPEAVLGLSGEGWKCRRRELGVAGLLDVEKAMKSVGEVREEGTGGGGGGNDLITSPTSEEILPGEGRRPELATEGGRVGEEILVLGGEMTLIVDEEETFPSLVG